MMRPKLPQPSGEGADLLACVKSYLNQDDVALVRRALDLASEVHLGYRRLSGQSYLAHVVQVAQLLAEWQAPARVVAAGLLHDVAKPRYAHVLSSQELGERLDRGVADITSQVARLGRLGPAQQGGESGALQEVPRLDLLKWAAVILQNQPDAIVVKIADRLINFLTLDVLPEDRAEAFARSTRNIFVPFAERLGMRYAKRLLEDAAFAVLHPSAFARMAEQYGNREQVSQTYGPLLRLLKMHMDRHRIQTEISLAPFGLQELYRFEMAMTRSNRRRPVPILMEVKSEAVCYRALRALHKGWRPRHGEFRDFIAAPKPNSYRSLHSVVRSPDGEYLLVLIRDHTMHLVAEWGVTAAWRGVPTRLLPSLPTWKQPPKGYIVVFTPEGELIQLPEGSCPVDFAYAIHPELGNQCSGATVNGQHVALDTKLRTGDVVKILTSVAGVRPSLEWLDFVKTRKAKREIKRWTQQRTPTEASRRGREMVDDLLREHGTSLATLVGPVALAKISTQFGYGSGNALFEAVGLGERSAQSVVEALLQRHSKKTGG
ncbi:MAG: bifunctional (p)ppGpp synthetase/guanosine-3',5'-bis(diphosphate) 3'-pyrophosphohydrolase, partial [Chloroflexi bacterium]